MEKTVLEIVERRKGKPTGSLGEQAVTPNEVRLNGQSLMVPLDSTIQVHEMGPHAAVRVTVTLYVTELRMHVEYEGD